jgi:hypothetical protein
MRVKNASLSIFDNFSEDELVAITFALSDRADTLDSTGVSDPAYTKFLRVMAEKIDSLVNPE